MQKLAICLLAVSVAATSFNSLAENPRPLIEQLSTSQEDQEFIVQSPDRVENECLSYYAYDTPDQATILIPWRLLSELSAPKEFKGSAQEKKAELIRANRARALIRNTDYSRLNAWGCANVNHHLGDSAELLFDLLDSGSVVVVNDSISKPVSEFVVRYHKDDGGTWSYHLSPQSKAFLTKNSKKIARDSDQDEHENTQVHQWGIDREPRKESDQKLYGFLRRFIASCRSERQEEQTFYLSHIGFPLNYQFSFVNEKGKQSAKGVLKNLRSNGTKESLGLPICIGDGGLSDVSVRKNNARAIVDLSFGSGPNEILRFKLSKGTWMLDSAEWIDH
ncbi:hypothetical protein [Undibacterium terreum]|uniref:Uncharacterized protein n=1 Tax=Undibacterium terreum TaxID=1224302 RepID=A0A916UN69_9BURK|nr:hypothetical protein [Undibacterium terreum]GGC77013.1 hypothetical protein GCM10011396_25260 [Undibacterium terreum]